MIAIGLTCPLIVSNANNVIAPHDTPSVRSAVPNSSAGKVHERGPLVMEETKVETRGMTMKPQWALVLVGVAGVEFYKGGRRRRRRRS